MTFWASKASTFIDHNSIHNSLIHSLTHSLAHSYLQPSQHELKRILTPEMYDKYDRLLLQVSCIGGDCGAYSKPGYLSILDDA